MPVLVGCNLSINKGVITTVEINTPKLTFAHFSRDTTSKAEVNKIIFSIELNWRNLENHFLGA
jgi:hypothetical protein